MDIQVVDVTLHIDQTLDAAARMKIDDALRAVEGVISVHNPDDRPNLCVVGYNPDQTNSAAILEAVRALRVDAELIGL
jgi:hypothetical protein